jgi:hypothetical protein
VADIAAVMADGEAVKAEIIGDDATGRVLVITAEPGSIEATARPVSDVPAKKPAGKGKKSAATEDRVDK